MSQSDIQQIKERTPLEQASPGAQQAPEQGETYRLDRYAVCTPYWGAVDLGHMDSMAQLRSRYDRFRTVGCPYIDQARAALCKMAENHAGVFFIDHDIRFHPEDVDLLIDAAEAEQTVVAGIYCERKEGKGRIVGCIDPSYEEVHCFARGGLYRAMFGGLGFCAIPRAVLEEVGRGMPRLNTSFMADVLPMFVSDISDGQYRGEDVSFFKRVRAAGFTPLIHTVPRLLHVGGYAYALEDANITVPRFDWLRLNNAESKPAPQDARAPELMDPTMAHAAPAPGQRVEPPPRAAAG